MKMHKATQNVEFGVVLAAGHPRLSATPFDRAHATS